MYMSHVSSQVACVEIQQFVQELVVRPEDIHKGLLVIPSHHVLEVLPVLRVRVSVGRKS